MQLYHAKENSRRKNEVSKCKTRLTGLVFIGIIYVDKIVPDINSNMTYD